MAVFTLLIHYLYILECLLRVYTLLLLSFFNYVLLRVYTQYFSNIDFVCDNDVLKVFLEGLSSPNIVFVCDNDVLKVFLEGLSSPNIVFFCKTVLLSGHLLCNEKMALYERVPSHEGDNLPVVVIYYLCLQVRGVAF